MKLKKGNIIGFIREKKIGKFLSIITGLFGIILFSLSLFLRPFGWWSVNFTADWLFSPLNGITFISAIGSTTSTSSLLNGLFLPWLFYFSGIIYLHGSVFITLSAYKESRIFALLSAFMMIGGLCLFCIALATFPLFLAYAALGFSISGNVYSGSSYLWAVGTLTWGLTNAFWVAVASSVIALIVTILDLVLNFKK
ncbi:MAG: hypothetical protein ACFFBD_11570 [Candidatus Hodarchaeota archaeon]